MRVIFAELEFGRPVAMIFAAALSLAVPLTGHAQTRSPIDEGTRWTLAGAGDVIMNRQVMQFNHPGDPAFQDLVNVIRGADAAFMNLEQSVFRLQEFTGWPAAENGGNYEVGSPETLGRVAPE